MRVPGSTVVRRADTSTATLGDVIHGYRLILEHDPTRKVVRTWRRELRQRAMSTGELRRHLQSSEEYEQQQAASKQYELVELDDFNIYVHMDDFAVGGFIQRWHEWEPEVTAAMRPRVPEGGVVLDVGANIGFFTLLAASLVGPKGHVIAVEASAANCTLIERSLGANDFGHVGVHAVAASDEAATQHLYRHESNSTHVVLPAEGRGGLESKPVAAVALDETLAELERLDLVKTDIDGGEPRAVQGMRRLLERHRPLLFTEFSPPLLRRVSEIDPRDYLELLGDLGYELQVIGERGPGERLGVEEIVTEYERRQAKSPDVPLHLDLLARRAEPGDTGPTSPPPPRNATA